MHDVSAHGYVSICTQIWLSNMSVLTCTHIHLYGYLSMGLWVFVLVLDVPSTHSGRKGVRSTLTFYNPTGDGAGL